MQNVGELLEAKCLAMAETAKQREQNTINKPSLNLVSKPSLINNINIKPSIIPSLNQGFKPISKMEFHRTANQLTFWGVSNSGAVIKREGATYVQMAVKITLNSLETAKSPKAYFRGVLKNIQSGEFAL